MNSNGLRRVEACLSNTYLTFTARRGAHGGGACRFRGTHNRGAELSVDFLAPRGSLDFSLMAISLGLSGDFGINSLSSGGEGSRFIFL